MTSVSGEMNSVTRCWRGRTDTSAPMRTTSSRSFMLWPREALHTSSTTCCPVCQRCDNRWALRSHPLPQPFIESHLLSFSHPGRPSHTPKRTRPLPLNLCASQNDFERGQKLQFNLDVQTRLQGLSGGVRVCTRATWPGHACRQRWHVSPPLTRLHAPRFYPKQRCCPAPFVARRGRRAVGTGDACVVPSPSLLCPPPLPSLSGCPC